VSTSWAISTISTLPSLHLRLTSLSSPLKHPSLLFPSPSQSHDQPRNHPNHHLTNTTTQHHPIVISRGHLILRIIAMASGDDHPPTPPIIWRHRASSAPLSPHCQYLLPSSPFPNPQFIGSSPAIGDSLQNLVRSPANINLEFPPPRLVAVDRGEIGEQEHQQRSHFEQSLPRVSFGNDITGRSRLCQPSLQEMQDRIAPFRDWRNETDAPEPFSRSDPENKSQLQHLLRTQQLNPLDELTIQSEELAAEYKAVSQAVSDHGPRESWWDFSPERNSNGSLGMHDDLNHIARGYLRPRIRYRLNEFASPGRDTLRSVSSTTAVSNPQQLSPERHGAPSHPITDTVAVNVVLKDGDDVFVDRGGGQEGTRSATRFQQLIVADQRRRSDVTTTPITQGTQNYSVSISGKRRSLQGVSPTTNSVLPGKFTIPAV